MCGGPETASGKQFSLPTVQALGINLRLPGLVARPLLTDLSHQFYAHTSGKHRKKMEGRKEVREEDREKPGVQMAKVLPKNG